jgi:hypothetical protein
MAIWLKVSTGKLWLVLSLHDNRSMLSFRSVHSGVGCQEGTKLNYRFILHSCDLPSMTAIQSGILCASLFCGVCCTSIILLCLLSGC